MDRTNVYQGIPLLDNAGSTIDYIARIADADQLWHVVNGPLTQNHLNRHAAFLRTQNLNTWLQKEDGPPAKYVPCEGDRPFSHPIIMVSPGMQALGKERTQYAGDQRDADTDSGPHAEDMAYVLVIQGQTGDARAKVVVEMSRERVASVMMSEAMNGYSTVFSAAVLKADLGELADQAYALWVVGGRRMLGKRADGEKSVDFWCDTYPEITNS